MAKESKTTKNFIQMGLSPNQNNEKIKKYSCINFQKVFLSRIEGLNMGLVISQKPKEQERGIHQYGKKEGKKKKSSGQKKVRC